MDFDKDPCFRHVTAPDGRILRGRPVGRQAAGLADQGAAGRRGCSDSLGRLATATG